MALTAQFYTGSIPIPTHLPAPLFDLENFDPPVGFQIHPHWASSQGSAISLSCQTALLQFPVSGMISPKFSPSFVTSDHCFLGLYVTHPEGWKPTKVRTRWENLQDWVAAAVMMNSGTIPGGAGWSLDLAGGAQVCYFEGTYIDPTLKCAGAKWYQDNPQATLADCLDSNSPSWPKPAFSPPPLPTPPAKDVFIAVPRPVPTWVVGAKLPYQDCIRLLTGQRNALTYLAWFGENGGITFSIPWIWTVGRCRIGLFLTYPASTLEGLRPIPMGINFQHEAFMLVDHTVKPLGTGGFVDLVNGWQIVVYDKAIDPKDLCVKARKKNLRTCLDDLIRLGLVSATRNFSMQNPLVVESGASSSRDHAPKMPPL